MMEPSFPVLQAEILDEISKVVTALGATETDNCLNDFDVGEFQDFVNQVIQDTSANKSSMYQDIAQGQRTEIDHLLNGYIVRKGSVKQSRVVD